MFFIILFCLLLTPTAQKTYLFRYYEVNVIIDLEFKRTPHFYVTLMELIDVDFSNNSFL
jgi:hypothetical protein